MFCPRCGQQQATDSMRFCARCGFPLEGSMMVLAHGGMLPHYEPAPGAKEASPRRKGVKQGALMFLLGAILVPTLGVLYNFTDVTALEVLCVLSAILFCGGGPLRILYAALFEEGAPTYKFAPPSYAPPAISPQSVRVTALPPTAPPANPASSWRARPQTAEIFQPSVTDNTTRLLNKSDPEPE